VTGVQTCALPILNVDPDHALRRTNTKFRKRFGYIEKQIEATGNTMASANLDTMETLWQQAKDEA